MNNNKKSSVTQLIEEIQRRIYIIQSEPQTMARELMIDNLSVDLEKYEVMHKEEMVEFAQEVFRNRYNQIHQSLSKLSDNIYYETFEGGNNDQQ